MCGSNFKIKKIKRVEFIFVMVLGTSLSMQIFEYTGVLTIVWTICNNNHKQSHLVFKIFQQLNDSSVIISILESYLVDPTQSIEKLVSYYPGIEGPNEEGKNTIDYPNKYFIMYQEHLSDRRTPEQRRYDLQKN